jgi:Etoposide-induced protein 2.4 (EI24)
MAPSRLTAIVTLFLAGLSTSVLYTRESLYVLTSSEKARVRVLQTAVVNIPLILLSWYWVDGIRWLAGQLAAIFQKSGPEAASHRAAVDAWVSVAINALGLFPYFLVATIISTVWAGDIATEAIEVMKIHQKSGSSGPAASSSSTPGPLQGIAEVLYRTVLVLLLNVAAVLLDVLTPAVIGKPSAILLTAIVTSIVAHDPLWTSVQGVSKIRCFKAVEAHAPYHVGFGLLAALLTFFGNAVTNGAAYNIVLPWLYLAALLHPPEKMIKRWDKTGALLEADVGFPFLSPLQGLATALFAWLHARFSARATAKATAVARKR